jgi:hypothetical protein
VKVAVAMFGLPRAASICLPSIEKNILSVISRYADVKVFFHLYRQERVDNIRSAESGSIDPAVYELFANFEGVVEHPNSCPLPESYGLAASAPDFYEDNYASVRNIFRQMHSLATVTEMAKSVQPDVVVYVRPDLLYASPMPDKYIEHAASHEATCLLPRWQWWGGVNDRFSVCGAKAIDAYGHRGRLIAEYTRRGARSLNAERLLDYALRKSGIVVRSFELRASRVRVDGSIKDENFSARQTAGGLSSKLRNAGNGLVSRLVGIT